MDKLKSDSDGYLVGDADDNAMEQAQLDALLGIRLDAHELVKLTRRTLSETRAAGRTTAAPSAKPAEPRGRSMPAAFPRARDAAGRFLADARPMAVPAGHGARPVATPTPRSSPQPESGGTGAARSLTRAAAALQATAARVRAPDVDPSLAAAGEVRAMAAGAIDAAKTVAAPVAAIATPLGRGFGRLMGRNRPEVEEERKQTSILRRMLRVLSGQRPGGGPAGGGLFDAFGGLFDGLKSGLLGLLGGAAGALVGTVMPAIASALGSVVVPLLRRLPVLGPLLAAGLAGKDVLDESLPADQRRTAGLRAGGILAGGLGGAALGAAIGTALLPGIGTVVGGIVGAMGLGYIGDTIGKITGESWDAIIATVSETWDRGIKAFDQYVIEPGRKAFEVLTEFVMNLPGVQAGKFLYDRGRQVVDQVREGGGRAVAAARQFLSDGADRIGSVMGWNRADAATQQAIREAAAAVGVDPALLATMASKESSLNPSAKASTSSATGLFQFVDRTWLDTIGAHGAKHGINTAGMTREQILAMRTDPRVSALMGAELLKANQAGVGSTPAASYLAHFLGLGGARKVLGADPTTPIEQLLSAEQIKANSSIFATVRTAGDLQGWAHKTMLNRSGGALALPATSLEAMLSAKPQALAVPTIPPVVAGGGFDQLNSQKPRSVVLLPARDKASQNVGDRSIAHIATGGIGLAP